VNKDVNVPPRQIYQDNIWVLEFINLLNYRYAKDECFVNHFTYLLIKFFKDNKDFLSHFYRLIRSFREGNPLLMKLNFLGELYDLSIVEFVAEYNVSAAAQCCYADAEIMVANKTSVVYNKLRPIRGMEISLFHEIIHILIHKTGHDEKNREKFIHGLSPLIHDYYKNNEEEW
jgi:hypothetical protein